MDFNWDSRMQERTALVTNASQFVGPPAVAALCAAGFTVIAQDRLFSQQDVCEQFKASNPDARLIDNHLPEESVDWILERYQTLDVLVSNDVYPAIQSSIEEADLHQLQQTMEHVAFAPFRLVKRAIPVIKTQDSARVILITSCRTELMTAGGAIPDMARAAANTLVKSLSLELAPYNIPVNAIAPNYLYSEAYFPKEIFQETVEGREYIQSEVPMGRLADPSEVGELVRYLATTKGTFQTGSIINFSGGWPAGKARPTR